MSNCVQDLCHNRRSSQEYAGRSGRNWLLEKCIASSHLLLLCGAALLLSPLSNQNGYFMKGNETRLVGVCRVCKTEFKEYRGPGDVIVIGEST